MKRQLAFLGVVIVGIVGFAVYKYGPVEYTAPEVVTKEVTVTEIEREEDVRIKEAQEAARVEIENKAQAAYDDVIELEMNKIKASVLEDVEEEIRSRRMETEKEISAY